MKRHYTHTGTLTWSVHLDTLVGSLWTLAVVAVSSAAVTLEAVHGEDVLGAVGVLPVAVLGQIALILRPAALLGPR